MYSMSEKRETRKKYGRIPEQGRDEGAGSTGNNREEEG